MEATEEKTDYARVLELARLVGRLQADLVYLHYLTADLVRYPDHTAEYLAVVNRTVKEALDRINEAFK